MGANTRNRFLPSLLDRLTDEESINHSLSEVRQKIKQIESELNNLSNLKREPADQNFGEQKEKERDLQFKLNALRVQQHTLNSSISSKQDILACVKRDLEWLLNTNQFFLNDEHESYPEAARSVLNYGTPDLTGKTVSGLNLVQLERHLLQAIINFEPRIIQKTLSIKVIADPVKTKHNIFVFEIEGELCAKPLPIHLHLRTEFELENSQAVIYDIH